MNYIKHALVASVSVALVACGGGSGTSGSTAPASTTIAAPASTTTSTSTTATASTTPPSSGSTAGGVHFLYTSSIDKSPSGSIVNGTATYAIGANGALTLSSSIGGSGTSDYMDFHPSGKFAYISSDNGARGNSTETITQYSVATDGSLTPLAVPTLTTDILSGWSLNLMFDPSGKFAFVSGEKATPAGAGSVYDPTHATDTLYFPDSNSVIETYAVNANGTLSLLSTLTLPSTPVSQTITDITVNPITNTLAVAAYNMNTESFGTVTTQADSTITTYSIGSNGRLTAVGSPVALSLAQGIVNSIEFDPSGKFAYASTISVDPEGTVDDATNGYIYEYTVASNGALTPMATPFVKVGINPVQVVIDTSSKYAYVPNMTGNTISQFTIGANGALTPMSVPTVYAARPSAIGFSPNGGYLYVGSNATPNITAYSIGSSGALTAGTVTNTADSTTAVGLVSFITTH